MGLKAHISLLAQAIVVWGLFWLAGWPDYFQQYATLTMGVACTLLATAFGVYAVMFLAPRRRGRRMPIAIWFSFYYTVPFIILDTLYCGIYLGLGWDYLRSHWYLTVFYVSIWLQFPPTAWVLDRIQPAPAGAAAA